MHELDSPRDVRRRQRVVDPAPGPGHLVAHEHPIHEAVRPLLVELAHLRVREHMPPGDVLFEHARTQLNKLRAKLEDLGLSAGDVRDIYYALVAFVDEVMQADHGPLKDFWEAHLLQLELFGETRAGEGFYDRLAQAQSERRISVLRVYYLCLLFGFQGIYAKHGELERENLIEEVRADLGIPSDSDADIAPLGARPVEPAADRERNRLLLYLAWAAVSLSVVWYVGIAFTLDARTRVLSHGLAQAAADLSAIASPSRSR